MAAVARRTQTNGDNHDMEEGQLEHQLDDVEAAILQVLIAKRVLKLDDALKVFDAIVEAVGISIP
jgi:hypothetical protein